MGLYSDREAAKAAAVAALRAASTAKAQLAALRQCADAHLNSPGWREVDANLLDAFSQAPSLEVRGAWARVKLQIAFDRTAAKAWMARIYGWGESLTSPYRETWLNAWTAWAGALPSHAAGDAFAGVILDHIEEDLDRGEADAVAIEALSLIPSEVQFSVSTSRRLVDATARIRGRDHKAKLIDRWRYNTTALAAEQRIMQAGRWLENDRTPMEARPGLVTLYGPTASEADVSASLRGADYATVRAWNGVIARRLRNTGGPVWAASLYATSIIKHPGLIRAGGLKFLARSLENGGPVEGAWQVLRSHWHTLDFEEGPWRENEEPDYYYELEDWPAPARALLVVLGGAWLAGVRTLESLQAQYDSLSAQDRKKCASIADRLARALGTEAGEWAKSSLDW